MPGSHLQVTIFQTWADVGGADLWLASWHSPNTRWYTGWHTPREMSYWHLTRPKEWELIGWEFWKDDCKRESFFIQPNPSLTPKHIYTRSTPKTGLQHNCYDEEGDVISTAWVQDQRVWRWSAEQEFLKGGNCKGTGKDTGGPKGDKGGPKGGYPEGGKGSSKGGKSIKGTGKDKGSSKRGKGNTLSKGKGS